MSDGMNKVILFGNLGSDPELRYTANGTAVLSLRIATNESFLDKNKEVQERTEWHTVVVWGTRAEALARTLTKGTGLLVEGGLRTSSYEKEGVKRYRTEVHAREICLSGRRAASPQGPVDDDVMVRSQGAPKLEEEMLGRPPAGARNGRSPAVAMELEHAEDLPF
jgi:single-strand DNA-binding protein